MGNSGKWDRAFTNLYVFGECMYWAVIFLRSKEESQLLNLSLQLRPSNPGNILVNILSILPSLMPDEWVVLVSMLSWDLPVLCRGRPAQPLCINLKHFFFAAGNHEGHERYFTENGVERTLG